MPLWLLLIVLSLAAYRLTRLAVKDTFPPILRVRCAIMLRGMPFKEAWENGCHAVLMRGGKLDQAKYDRALTLYRPSWEWLADLVTCHWCASGWISLGLVLGTAWWYSLPAPVLIWFAVWAAGAWLANVEDRAAGSQSVKIENKAS